MAAVGYPLWLSINNDSTHQHATMHFAGQTVALDAIRTTIQFRMGDGNTISCATTTPWTPQVTPGTESPTCGYRYTKPSLPAGKYRITAVASWNITWTVMGQSGVVHVQKAGGKALPVGELQSIVVR
ncbi:hypothetical protein [Acidipropionibacterium timonense]|uniref:hypothetical protein n=1 Tax=Acidipropionibacterium timonense TaxID=2161818 RepID=UPI0014369890|nr:hypothetical protein [Acidipropionibacterium timonense]